MVDIDKQAIQFGWLAFFIIIYRCYKYYKCYNIIPIILIILIIPIKPISHCSPSRKKQAARPNGRAALCLHNAEWH